MVDLAVAVPTCTLVAVRRAVPLAARLGTLGTVRLVERVSEAVYEMRAADEIDEVLADNATSEPADDATPSVVSGPAESVSVEDLPIEGYDDLAARQVVDRLETLDRPDLARVELYEREHRSRSTVLGKISILTA